MHYVKYFIWSKWHDPEKPLFVLGVFVILSYISKGMQVMTWNWKEFGVSFLVFEVFAYQARYQINDLRDIGDDRDSDDRLFPKGVSKNAYIIELSAILAGIKIILAFVCTYFLGGRIKKYLYIELVALAIITVIYERIRDTYNLDKICFWVGAGYPLRFIVVAMAVGPKYMNNVTEGKLLLFYFLLIISPWTLGSMASVAQWVADVVKLKALSIDSYGKKHYIKLAERIEERYNLTKEKKTDGKIYPLREGGKMNDIWNVYFIISICSSSINVLFQKESAIGQVILGELLTWVMLLVLIKWASYRKIIYCNAILIILILIKYVFAWKCGFETGCVIYIFQWMVVGTYFYVTYRPQFKKIDMKKFLIYFMKGVLGEEAARCIVNDKEKK